MTRVNPSLSFPPGLRIEREWTDPITGERLMILSYALDRPALSADGASAFASLSQSEQEVCRLIGKGLNNAEIAAKRGGRSVRTIANQIAAVFKKLNVKSRTELIAFLRRCAILMVLLLPLCPQVCPQTAFAEAPSGRLRCIGKSSSGSVSYTGEVDVISFQGVHIVLWTIAGNLHVGHGIERDGHFAVIYLTTDKINHGVALYEKRGGDWVGVWTPHDGTEVLTEIWRL